MAKAKSNTKTKNVAADNSAANVSDNIPEQAQETTPKNENSEVENSPANVSGDIPEQAKFFGTEKAMVCRMNEYAKKMGLSEIYENSRGEYFTRPDLALNSEAGNAANVKHYKA